MRNVSPQSLKAEIDTYLDRLVIDLNAYRVSMNRVFSRKLSRSRDCRGYFRELLISASQLYLDYLLLLNRLPKFEKESVSTSGGRPVGADTRREAPLRERLRKRLESLPCWSCFRPANPFSELTGLNTLADYIDAFALHLPEVYEETSRVEAAATIFRDRRSDSALADLIVGLQHMGRHHITFVHFALEWAADEGSWTD